MAKPKATAAPKLSIRYREAPGFRIVPATGCFGGPTPQGMVYLGFWHDHIPPPTETIRDQETGEEERRYKDQKNIPLDRVLEFAVLLTAENARSIGEWLISKAEAVKTGTLPEETTGDEQSGTE